MEEKSNPNADRKRIPQVAEQEGVSCRERTTFESGHPHIFLVGLIPGSHSSLRFIPAQHHPSVHSNKYTPPTLRLIHGGSTAWAWALRPRANSARDSPLCSPSSPRPPAERRERLPESCDPPGLWVVVAVVVVSSSTSSGSSGIVVAVVIAAVELSLAVAVAAAIVELAVVAAAAVVVVVVVIE